LIKRGISERMWKCNPVVKENITLGRKKDQETEHQVYRIAANYQVAIRRCIWHLITSRKDAICWPKKGPRVETMSVTRCSPYLSLSISRAISAQNTSILSAHLVCHLLISTAPTKKLRYQNIRIWGKTILASLDCKVPVCIHLAHFLILNIAIYRNSSQRFPTRSTPALHPLLGLGSLDPETYIPISGNILHEREWPELLKLVHIRGQGEVR
jgi:hypothetical protein